MCVYNNIGLYFHNNNIILNGIKLIEVAPSKYIGRNDHFKYFLILTFSF